MFLALTTVQKSAESWFCEQKFRACAVYGLGLSLKMMVLQVTEMQPWLNLSVEPEAIDWVKHLEVDAGFYLITLSFKGL